MEISDIRIKLIQDAGDRLKAVCSITLDDEFVVRDLKVVEGTNGLFVAMPSRKLSVHCPQCRAKNHLRAKFCNECGGKLPPPRLTGDGAGRMRMHRDIAHPINPGFRELVQTRVIEKYRQEAELAKSPDYMPTDIDADYEEAPEDNIGNVYAPSEYDQLIAGLNKGAQEGSRDRETRPAARPQRQGERRMPARPSRATPPKAPQYGRESREHEAPRPSRGQGGRRPAPPARAPRPVREYEPEPVEEPAPAAPVARQVEPVVRRPETASEPAPRPSSEPFEEAFGAGL